MGEWMPTLDEETARAFRICQLQRRRWSRVADALADDPVDLRHLIELLTACRAATEIEFRQASRRCFDLHDRMATALIPKEGQKMTEGYRASLLARAEWHKKLARECRGADVVHAEMHTRLASQLTDYARNGAPGEPKAAAPETPVKPKAPVWKPGMRSRL
jgi:hypothetical protein